ncbi:MAG: 30S ribosomal protein S27e [Candidatus Pacearchaeota archaeon]|nr:30S ribosomal protein S27e [Candidatus Pacearchaeota archaeon]
MRPTKEIRITKSKFIKVRCPKCNFEQNIFGKATMRVKCLKCNYQLTRPAASKAKIKAKVLEVFK